MAAFTFSDVVNFISTTLTNTITDSTPGNSGSLVLGDTTGFPTTGYACIDIETLKYSAVASGTALTLAGSGARGALSTIAAAHNAGAIVRLAIVSAHINELTDKFHATTGHTHTGVAGDGPLVSGQDANALIAMQVFS